MSGGPDVDSRPRSLLRLTILLIVSIVGVSGLTTLGAWQLHRRAWKLNLIEQVDQRIHAVPAAPPGPSQWSAVTAKQDAYRKITLHGVFLNDKETLIESSTVLGPGYWLITPLQTDEGFIILVNRGFVPPENKTPATRPQSQIIGETIVTGLLRITEPKGRLLRANDPAANHWYSCDVAAIAAARNLPDTAPYYIDADNMPNPGGIPTGGLTVVAFPNNHLIYAITWFSLALLLAGTTFIILRDE